MRISSVQARIVRLPFRFSFKHSLAARNYSHNVIVRVDVENNGEHFRGYGESIPRDYVTGESCASAVDVINETYVPALRGTDFSPADLCERLRQLFLSFGLDKRQKGSSWCALELAILDAACRCFKVNVADVLSPEGLPQRDAITYGGVVPFGNRRALFAILWFYKLYGFKTVKLKVGEELETDVAKLRLARKILGDSVTLRVDANCAWTVESTLRAAEAMRPFAVSSIEQPLPADDLEGMAKVTASLPESIVADESLCTIEQAEALAQRRACNAFNIRVSKVGGILAAGEIALLARRHGIKCHLGAQVGESGILSGAGRIFAATQPDMENYEGSANFFLLKKDLTRQNLTAGRNGRGRLLRGPGLGVEVSALAIDELEDKEAYSSCSPNSGRRQVMTGGQGGSVI